MNAHETDTQWIAGDDRPALAAFVRARLPGRSWGDVKKLVASGRVIVEGEPETDAGRRLEEGERVTVREHAPRARPRGEVRIVHDDPHVVVVDKPAGIMSVPFEPGDRGTAMDLVREAWRRKDRSPAPLFVVHRIDKDTSGLLAFAKTRRAESELAGMFRRHEIDRAYQCVAHGRVEDMTLDTDLVPDRGDGLRGSSDRGGKRAVTHVRALESGRDCTLCEVRLETGRTHQIRIHLAEAGHPLVGERVYIRDWTRSGCPVLPSPRLLLHAIRLGFTHPVTGERLGFLSPWPSDFRSAWLALGGRS